MDPNDFFTKPLPGVRADLEVYQGPDEADGSPSYSIYDPIRAIYFKGSWAEVAILKHLKPGMSIKELMQIIYKETTLRLSPEEVCVFLMELEQHGLLVGFKESDAIHKKAEEEKGGWLKWLVLNYLFIKIPLVNPNSFLDRTVQYVMPLMSRTALYIYGFLSLWGLALVLTRWSEFVNTFPYFFNITGFFAYAVAIIVTKIIHEMSHAYTAKKYGLEVPTMGIAFLVLWPVLYTDATHAWRLHDRKARLLISAAGIFAELFMAGLATIGWAFSDPGILQSVFFVVASVNWISTLVINLNPALRFDGYYLLSDLLEVDNLQSRAFSMLRFKFWRIVAGAEIPDPEPKMGKGRKRLMVFYAMYTWVYRVFLYTAIALFVYYKFTKVIGITLFIVEVIVFFVWPIVYEFQFYQKIKKFIRWNLRLKVTSSAIILFLIWFVLPWPVWVDMPAITIPYHNQNVYAPSSGEVDKLYVERGQEVKRGDPVLWVKSEEVDNQIQVLEKEAQVTKKQIDITQLTDENLPFYMEQQLKLAQTEAELDAYRKLKEQNLVISKVDGVVYFWDDFLREGLLVKEKMTLAKIATKERINLVAFVYEDNARYINVGDWLVFKPVQALESYDAQVVSVSPVRTQYLRYPQLSSVYEGELPVVQVDDDQFKMIESYYTVELKLAEGANLRFGRTGDVEFWGPWRSRALQLVEYIISVLLSESGF